MTLNANSDIRFALYLAEPLGLQDVLDLGIQAESWGFDILAVCQNLFWWEAGEAPVWDIFTVLTTLANRTQNIDLMTNVIDPFARHPAVVAHILATFDHLWPGRLALGIGPGEIANYGPFVDLAGPPPHRLLTRTREFIEVMRGIWASTAEVPFTYDGRYFQMENAHISMKPVTKPNPPIYIAAMGPNMTRLTGKVADGWTPATYTPATYATSWQDVAVAATASGRDPSQIDRALTIPTVISQDGAQAKEVASLTGRFELVARPDLLRELGYDEFADDRFSLANTDGISTGQHLVEKLPQALGTEVTISGTPHEAIPQIEAFIEAGVKRFVLWPPYNEPALAQETIAHYQQTILPYFHAKR